MTSLATKRCTTRGWKKLTVALKRDSQLLLVQ